ncbi:MAG: class I SAM-dependent methyltransferase [Acidimicrobiales bacterium]
MLTVDYERLGVRAGQRVLDLGAGFGRHAFEAARRGADVTAVDLSPAELTSIRATFAAMHAEGERCDPANLTLADATRLPFHDATFDRIIASEVLEHVPDDGAALAELVRVLQPGGALAVTVPAWLPERVCWALTDEYHAPFVEGGHVRIYRRRRLVAMIEAAGLVVHGHHKVHSLHSPYWWLKCAVGVTDDEHRAVRAWHRLLLWDISRRPLATRTAERILDPLIGKSLVIYATRPALPWTATPAKRGVDRAA